jgi:hypothetical protein
MKEDFLQDNTTFRLLVVIKYLFITSTKECRQKDQHKPLQRKKEKKKKRDQHKVSANTLL